MHEPAVDGTSRPAASEALTQSPIGRAKRTCWLVFNFIATEKKQHGNSGGAGLRDRPRPGRLTSYIGRKYGILRSISQEEAQIFLNGRPPGQIALKMPGIDQKATMLQGAPPGEIAQNGISGSGDM